MSLVDIYEGQQEVNDIIYDAMDLFWNDHLLEIIQQKYFKQHERMTKFVTLEKLFLKACNYMPYRLDLKYSAAFFMISQGKIEQAIQIYQSITQSYPKAINAKILEAVYTKIIKGNQSYEEILQQYKNTHPSIVNNFMNAVIKAQVGFTWKMFDQKPFEISENKLHCIVVLGFVLNEDGTMKPNLVRRLEKSLQLYHLNPKSKIILSGGFPKFGRTQSYMMMNWFLEQGVSKDNLILEQKSKDTLGNALYVIPKLEEMGAEAVTIVTSSSHMRRALLLFEAVSEKRNYFPSFFTLVDPDADISVVSRNQQLAIMRDIIRAYGIWAIPGIFK